MTKTQINYWPYAITTMIFGTVIAAIITIKIAIENPVVNSNIFMNNYHITDKNINEILNGQIDFDKKYSISFQNNVIEQNDLSFELRILGENPQIEALLTRKETSSFDKKLTFKKLENNNIFQFKKINLSKNGIWRVLLKVTINHLTKYQILEFDTRKKNLVTVINPFISNSKLERIKKQSKNL